MCGIVGIYGQENAAEWATEALFSQQHRGQDSCGVATADGKDLFCHRGMGLVRECFTEEALGGLPGSHAIGHVRYPTQGEANVKNAQPHLFVRNGDVLFSLASNGDITNLPQLGAEIESRGYPLEGTNDAEVMAKAIGIWAYDDGLGIEGAIRKWMVTGMGAYCTVLLTPSHLYAFRDPHGLRPMSRGEKGGAAVIASETVALDILRAKFVEHVAPGAILKWGPGGLSQPEGVPPRDHHHCIFELIYFARPDSRVFNERVYEVRRAIGTALAKEDITPGDVVVPIPDSSNYIGLAYATARDLPIAFGLVRNHYIGRTFIAPEQRMRDDAVRLKFNPLPGFFEGKRVFLVDDSIVRGTTIRKLVHMVRDQGAKEVHLRIGSPPICHSCYYGVDTPDQGKLIASGRTPQEVAALLGADTLRYLSLEGLRTTVFTPGHYCYACFTGEYPAGCKG